MKLFDVYPLYEINIVKGQGCKVWDENGTEYLDLYGGHAVISIEMCIRDSSRDIVRVYTYHFLACIFVDNHIIDSHFSSSSGSSKMCIRDRQWRDLVLMVEGINDEPSKRLKRLKALRKSDMQY